MADAIQYCDCCGRMIPPSEIMVGHCYVRGGTMMCHDCRSRLPLGEQRALTTLRPSKAGRHVAALTSKPGHGASSSTSRRSRRSPVPAVPPPGARAKHIAIIGAACFLVGLACALAAGSFADTSEVSSRPRGNPPSLAVPAISTEPQLIEHRAGETTAAPGIATATSTPAALRLAAIERMITPDLAQYADVVRALKYFPSDFPGTPEALRAAELLAEVETDCARVAEEALSRAQADSDRLARDGRFDDAVSTLRAVEARFRGGSWLTGRGGKRLAAAVSAIERQRPAPVPTAPSVTASAGPTHHPHHNFARGTSVAASSSFNSATGPALAVDGDRSNGSCWESGALPAWIEIDLGTDVMARSVDIWPWWDGRHSELYSIEVSRDRVSWTKVSDSRKRRSPPTNANVLHGFSPVRARYVRVHAHEFAGGAGRARIAEVVIKGTAVSRNASAPSKSTEAPPSPAPASNGHVPGLRAEYYNGTDPVTRKLETTRVDADLNHRWGTSQPEGLSVRDHFSVCWTGEVYVPANGTYTFHVTGDDEAALYTGSRLLTTGRWQDPGRAELALEKGWIPICLEYSEGNGGAEAVVEWEGPGIPERQPIPPILFRTRTLGGEEGVDDSVFAQRRGMAAAVARVEHQGYELSKAALERAASIHEVGRQRRMSIATFGGPLSASGAINVGLSARGIAAAAGYRFERPLAVPGAAIATPALTGAFATYLRKARPEVVRIAFDAANLPASLDKAATKEMREAITNFVSLSANAGAVPVLVNVPAYMGPGAPNAGVISQYDRMLLDVSRGLDVPLVDATRILNEDAARAKAYFTRTGAPTRAAFDAINERFAALYVSLERWGMGREREVTIARSPARASTSTRIARATELVTNGGFEREDADRRFAARWTAHAWGEATARATVRIDRANAHEGERSLVARTLAEGTRPGAFSTLSSTLSPGQYEATFWACADIDGNARVAIQIGDAAALATRVGDEWERVRFEITIAQGVSRPTIRVWTETTNVRVWFDDVSLKPSR